MKPDQPILAATDFSAPATLAVERAAQLARAWRCPLHLLHVFNPCTWEQARHRLPDVPFRRDPAAHGKTHLERLEEDIAGRYGLSALSSNLATGRASTTIVGFATAIDARLTVMGIRGEGIVHELALGGTAIKVLRRSPCPVLVVRGKSDQPYRRIVIGTDFSATATRALHAVLSMFPEAELLALHASRVPYEERMRLAGALPEQLEHYRTTGLASAQQDMEAYLAHARGAKAGAIAGVVRHGYPATVLLDELGRAPCDLLVLGRHGQSAMDEQLLGSVTLNLLHHAPCDVLLVP